MKSFYVASSFRNIANVRYVAQTLESMGYVNMYDWTQERLGGDAGAGDGSATRGVRGH